MLATRSSPPHSPLMSVAMPSMILISLPMRIARKARFSSSLGNTIHHSFINFLVSLQQLRVSPIIFHIINNGCVYIGPILDTMIH